MEGKSFTLGFTLAASLGSKFLSAFSEANEQLNKLEKSMDRLKKAQGRLNTAKFKGIIDNQSFEAASRGLNKQKGMEEWKATVDSFGQSYAKFALMYEKAQVLGGMLSEPVQKAIQFESAMADVKKVIDFDTPQQFKEMGNDILNLSKRIPMAAEGLAKIVAAGGQSGIAREDLISFAESAAKMGVAFDITFRPAKGTYVGVCTKIQVSVTIEDAGKLSSGQVGDTDGHTTIDSIRVFDYNDDEAVEK